MYHSAPTIIGHIPDTITTFSSVSRSKCLRFLSSGLRICGQLATLISSSHGSQQRVLNTGQRRIVVSFLRFIDLCPFPFFSAPIHSLFVSSLVIILIDIPLSPPHGSESVLTCSQQRGQSPNHSFLKATGSKRPYSATTVCLRSARVREERIYYFESVKYGDI